MRQSTEREKRRPTRADVSEVFQSFLLELSFVHGSISLFIAVGYVRVCLNSFTMLFPKTMEFLVNRSVFVI